MLETLQYYDVLGIETRYGPGGPGIGSRRG
jgi:hypothetical protein